MNKILFLLLMWVTIFAEVSVKEAADQGKVLKDVKLKVDADYSTTNTRADVYGKLLKRFVPGYKNYTFYSSEDEIRKTILEEKIVKDATAIIEHKGTFYYREQPSWDYVMYDPGTGQSIEINYTNNLPALQSVAFKEIAYPVPRYANDYKELVVEASPELQTVWEYHFLLYKEESALVKNTQNPYRLIAITLKYKNPKYSPSLVAVPMDNDLFDEFSMKVHDTLGAPYQRERVGVGEHFVRHSQYFFQSDIMRIVKGIPVGHEEVSSYKTQIAFSYLQMGMRYFDIQISFGELEALEKYRKHINHTDRLATVYTEKVATDLQ